MEERSDSDTGSYGHGALSGDVPGVHRFEHAKSHKGYPEGQAKSTSEFLICLQCCSCIAPIDFYCIVLRGLWRDSGTTVDLVIL